jgi:S-adenosylmethionine:tRNA ribosyltransferase-isomerase
VDDDRLAAYQYDLPPERIAQAPADRRDASRLMVLARGAPPAHHVFRDLPDLLAPGDLLVRNDTRVLPARLRGRRPGGGRTELLLVRRLGTDPDDERWLALARPSSHLKVDKPVVIGDGALTATVAERRGAGQVVVVFDAAGADFRRRLEAAGEVPLPPYIERGDAGPTEADRERYQTVYAREAGAVAAPTAGLHFTPEVEAALAARGVGLAHLTLHVGPGTFRPIKAERLDEHRMDAEWYRVPPETARAVTDARREGRRVLAVGTTVVRTLESAVGSDGTLSPSEGWTDLFIRPGHAVRAVDGLLTNFHLPGSSLLVLVSAFAGRERVLAAYEEAVRREYRFYSYGDAMLLLP